MERAARSWAAKHLLNLEVTAGELRRIEEFIRDEPDGPLSELRGRRRRAGSTMSRESWPGLRELLQRQVDLLQRRWVEKAAQREEERRQMTLAEHPGGEHPGGEHPGGEHLGGGLVRMPDGHVARSSAVASNDEMRSAIRLAIDATAKALLAQDRTLASLTDADGARDELRADERRRQNLAALENPPLTDRPLPRGERLLHSARLLTCPGGTGAKAHFLLGAAVEGTRVRAWGPD